MIKLALYATEDDELIREVTTEKSSVVQIEDNCENWRSADLKTLENKIKERRKS